MEIGFDDHLDMLSCSHSHVVVSESFQAHATTKFDRIFHHEMSTLTRLAAL
jgi:hypothetical protein